MSIDGPPPPVRLIPRLSPARLLSFRTLCCARVDVLLATFWRTTFWVRFFGLAFRCLFSCFCCFGGGGGLRFAPSPVCSCTMSGRVMASELFMVGCRYPRKQNTKSVLTAPPITEPNQKLPFVGLSSGASSSASSGA